MLGGGEWEEGRGRGISTFGRKHTQAHQAISRQKDEQMGTNTTA